VSDNRRFLIHDDGRPFFYLGDTAWELFHRPTRDEADIYLENRARKRFTVIQAVVLAELKGLTEPNANGDLPFADMDITRPDEKYFRHVDYIVGKANSLGMFVGMLPSWGDKVGGGFWGDGPAGFINEGNARAYGRFLGRRYAQSDIIWILGGDRPADGNEGIWRELAAGIKEGDADRGLMTYHPCGQYHSSAWFHHDDWLDFNMCQTGHSVFRDNFRDVQMDYNLRPPKPCIDGEPGYEDHPSGFNVWNGYMDDFQSRQFAYWAVFSGACGHTYGCNNIWQFYDRGCSAMGFARRTWKDSLDLPGSGQMRHVRGLIESRPYLSRIPDQGLVLAGFAHNIGHARATRDGGPGGDDATYIMVYFPAHRELKLATRRIASDRLHLWWYNPRDGRASDAGLIKNPGELKIVPPTDVLQEDWVLVIDDPRKNYPPPGEKV